MGQQTPLAPADAEFGLAQAHHGTARAGLQVPQHVQHHVVERPGLVQASR